LAIGPPGRQRRADAAEHGGLELPHQLADILHLARARAVRLGPWAVWLAGLGVPGRTVR